MTLFPDAPTSTGYPCYWARSAQEIQADFAERGWEWDDCFTFTVVRNPWDRLVSAYEFWRPDQQLRLVQDPEWDGRARAEFCDWVRKMVASGRAAEDPMFQQWPAITDDDGRLLVDFVGRFEELQEDWAAICRRIGIELRLPLTHRTRHRHYSTYYTPETARLVGEVCRRDIELFGYELETPGPVARLADQAGYLRDGAKNAIRTWLLSPGTGL